MAIGLREAFKAGISSARTTWSCRIEAALHRGDSAVAKEYEQEYNDGLITQGEKYNKVVDAWAKSPTSSPRR